MSKKKNGAMISILGKKVKFSDYRSNAAVTKVLYEINYTKFTLFDDNRDINESHVEELVKSMKKSGQLMPVIVNEHLEVMDGQHRVKSCEQLGIPVAYVINIGGTSKQIALLNNTQKSWKTQDYLKHYSHKNHPNHAEYKKIIKFFKEYKLAFGVGMVLLSKSTTRRWDDKGTMVKFKDGTFKIQDLEGAQITASHLLKFKSFVPNLVSIVKFCLAFTKIKALPNFNLELSYKQIEKNSNKFDKCVNQEDWIEAFVDAYNYKLVTKGKNGHKRISIRKEGF
tara:strand:+ start:101 stop:943 length:843 start_codon:yes stop_codon:yes gene_type:complete